MYSQVIHKYKLIASPTIIETPLDSKFLKVHSQGECIHVWFQQDKEPMFSTTNKHTFLIVRTGEEFDDYGYTYVDTVFISNGLVFHIFKKNEE